MNQRNPQLELTESSWPSRRSGAKWDLMECDRPTAVFKNPFSSRCAGSRRSKNVFSSDWANLVPSLIEKLVSEVVEKKKMELRFSLMESAVSELKSQLNVLAASNTRIVPIASFAPEPYEILKPILVSVQSVEGEFEAGWFDANIHTTGENEEEAVSNLKSLILDYFDSFSKEPIEKLGIEPKRQFAVIKTFIAKKA
jgi:hypothetical protein